MASGTFLTKSRFHGRCASTLLSAACSRGHIWGPQAYPGGFTPNLSLLLTFSRSESQWYIYESFGCVCMPQTPSLSDVVLRTVVFTILFLRGEEAWSLLQKFYVEDEFLPVDTGVHSIVHFFFSLADTSSLCLQTPHTTLVIGNLFVTIRDALYSGMGETQWAGACRDIPGSYDTCVFLGKVIFLLLATHRGIA